MAGGEITRGITSLPEILTGGERYRGQRPGCGRGHVVGSSLANLAILAVIDPLHRGWVWPQV